VTLPSIALDHELADAFGDRLPPLARLHVVRSRADLEALDDSTLAALVIRTDQRVDAALCARFPALRVVLTASAGRDHVGDLGALPVLDARGGNAPGVADWVVYALVDAFGPLGPYPCVGVLGCGATGSAVLDRLAALGVRTIACDPPRARRDPAFTSAPPEALGDADLLTLHVPLTPRGQPDATEAWLDEARLTTWRHPLHVLNASRGDVLDEAALRRVLAIGAVTSYRADVFQGEPRPDPATLAAARLVTPHVAGRSDDGRRGLQQRTLAALAAHFGWQVEPLPDLPPLEVEAPASVAAIPAWLDDLTGFGAADRAIRADPEAFRQLRATHARRDWRHVWVRGGDPATRARLRALGFPVQGR